MAGSVRVLMLTDLEGSTRLWAEHPAVMVDVMAEHHAILHAAIEAHGGTRPVDQGEGDAVFAAFESATEAIAAVLRFQRELAERAWPEGIVLRDRVGLHVGEVEERDGNLFGIAVSRAARIRSLAAGGQVLLSSSLVDLVDDRLPDGATTTDLGLHRLKDLTRPERIHQLDGPGARVDFPPLASLDRLPNNLPTERWPLIGRDAEVRDLVALVRDERLVTVVGFGGMGKTRLALQVAAELLDGSGDGVWFVDLAATEDAAAIPAAILAAVGAEEGTGTASEALHAWARARTALLVLDNLEQLLPDAAPILDDLLEAGPDLHLLVTSREPIRIAGERIWALAPLAPTASVRLLVDRAVAVRRDFALTAETQPVVEAICARLEGSPLAIELAAARLRAMSPEALFTRLDHALPVLSGGSRSLPARQQTVRATIEWSTRSLEQGTSELLDALSVFPGSFDLAAAEAVHPPADAVLEGLMELVDRSLVQTVDEEEGGDRYRLLVPIREFAAERLAASGAEDVVRDRHADRFTALVRLPPDWSDLDQRRADAVVRTDWHNVRLALDRLHHLGRSAEEIDLAPWLSIGLLMAGREGDGLRVLRHAVDDIGPTARTPAAALLWSLVARYEYLTSRGEPGRRSLTLAFDLVAGAGDDSLRVYLATLNTRQGDVLGIDPASIQRAGDVLRTLPTTGNTVPRWFLERIWSVEAIGAGILSTEETDVMVARLLDHAIDQGARARLEYDLGNVLVSVSRFGPARSLLEGFAEEDRLRLLPALLRPNVLTLLAELAIEAGLLTDATRFLDRADALLQQLDGSITDHLVAVMRAAVDRAAGRPDEAVARLRALEERDDATEAGVFQAYRYWLGAVLARERGDADHAVESLRAAWRIADRVGDPDAIRLCLLERSAQELAGDQDAVARWLALAREYRFVPRLHLAVRYDEDAMIASSPSAPVPRDRERAPLVLPPW